METLVIGGGFSANSQLRELAVARAEAAGIDVRIPPIRYCTDNGAMIAALGSALVRRDVRAITARHWGRLLHAIGYRVCMKGAVAVGVVISAALAAMTIGAFVVGCGADAKPAPSGTPGAGPHSVGYP